MEILGVVFYESRFFFIHPKTPSGPAMHTVGAGLSRYGYYYGTNNPL
jgi:hypothetical protein